MVPICQLKINVFVFKLLKTEIRAVNQAQFTARINYRIDLYILSDADTTQ